MCGFFKKRDMQRVDPVELRCGSVRSSERRRHHEGMTLLTRHAPDSRRRRDVCSAGVRGHRSAATGRTQLGAGSRVGGKRQRTADSARGTAVVASAMDGVQEALAESMGMKP